MANPNFHDAIILARLGASIYVADADGNTYSDGHHRVKWDGNDKFKGKTGEFEAFGSSDVLTRIWSQSLSIYVCTTKVTYE